MSDQLAQHTPPFYRLKDIALEYEHIYGPLYGKEWVLMAGDDGNPYYVNLTSDDAADDGHRGMFTPEIYFNLFTRQNTDEAELLIPCNGNVESEHFDKENDVKVITHGWMSGGSTEWLKQMKDAYLRTTSSNVIVVDWGEYAKNVIYPVPAKKTNKVGMEIAKLLDALSQSYGVNGSRIHLIGHSLGAQVMGYAGEYSSNRVSRITGLDPARPLFELPEMGASRRLDPSDAEFVDIIHTCAGVYGYLMSHGHADFYPNDGRPSQPGCEGIQYIIEACSHGRSVQYYIESIGSSNGFVSTQCSSYDDYIDGSCQDNAKNHMGAYADSTMAGDFYLQTNAEPRYSKDSDD
ncbi:unnamed protein product [Plutella xylostella]|uniref:(diamondback moth) hypothetical protein n=1 Tax=Plutella xylostella TaxID=51655 RepID=A0A8S4ECE1_PLUXY|nr:unnamed protein product [Plutella xylostella]